MPQFEGDELNIQINPSLNEMEKLHIFVTHDETLFYTNDGRKSGWDPDTEQPLRKKGQGQAIHVSDFLCETIGRLKLNEEQIKTVNESFPYEARVMINPEKNHDGYWNVEQLIKQVCNNILFL